MEKIAHIQLHYTHELTLNSAFLCSSENCLFVENRSKCFCEITFWYKIIGVEIFETLTIPKYTRKINIQK